MLISLVAGILYAVLLVYLLIMWARFILDLVQVLNRRWRPKGFGLVLTEVTYMLTDPPIRLVRRLIPPIRAGGMALDFAWSIVMLAVIILIILTGSIS